MTTETAPDLDVADPPSGPEPSGGPAARRSWKQTLVGGLLREARPKQWVKNVLVFAAPGAAGMLLQRPVFVEALFAFVVFSLAASGTYFVNDARDVDADRHHPRKCHRPIAAGVVPVWLGWLVGVGLMAASLGLAFASGNWQLGLVLAIYLTLTVNYSIWMKHIPLLDIAVVAAGFILRALAGGVATGVPISEWFIIVTSFGSLFMVVAKRRAEFHDVGEDAAGKTRAALAGYSVDLLNHMRTVSSAVCIVGYCLWAFEKADQVGEAIWFQLSIAPFLLALFRYAMVCDQGRGGAPEEVILGDRMLQALGLVWIGCFAVGIYAG